MAKKNETVVTAENVKVEGQPEIVQHEMFNIVKGPKGYFITITNKIVSSKLFASVESTKKYIDGKPWDLLVNTACTCFEIMNEQKQEQSK